MHSSHTKLDAAGDFVRVCRYSVTKHVDTVAHAELGSLHEPKLEPVVLARRTRKYRTFYVAGHGTVILKGVVFVLTVKSEEPTRVLKLSISDH